MCGTKISHRPLSKRLRIWQRRPSQWLKSPTTETRRRVRRPEREQHAVDALVRRDLRAEPLVELPVRSLAQQIVVDRPERRAESIGVDVGRAPDVRLDLDAIERAAPSPAESALRRSRPCAARARRAASPSRVSARTAMASGANARIDPTVAASGADRAQRKDRCNAPRAIASTSASRALQTSIMSLPAPASAKRHERRIPDLFRVFRDRAVGREPADIGGVDDARAHPRPRSRQASSIFICACQ